MNNKAFTLIELLLYTAIFAVVGGLMVGILLTVTQVQQRESAGAEITGQMNFVMQTIQRLVSQSSNIEIETGVATSTLKLRMQDSAKDPTCLSLVDGVIKLAEGPGENPGECNTDTSDLTSSRVIVDALTFKKFAQYPGHDTVSIDLTMTYNTTNPKGQVQRTLSSAIARVSAATFDSNVLPGSTSFTIGQSGSAWQNVFVNDGSAGSPSYSFGSDTNVGIFRAGTDILGFSTAGNERMRINASGLVGIATTTPSYTLDVYGTLRTSATSTFSGNVGIGTTNPGQKLSVAGIIESTSGGFKFPDGTTQTTAATGSFYLYNNAHTSVQCESAGGLVRPIAASYLCQFTGSSCPDGWTRPSSWGITYPNSCSSAGCQSCTTGSHEWNDTATETCTYYSAEPKQGCVIGNACTAALKAVGCY